MLLKNYHRRYPDDRNRRARFRYVSVFLIIMILWLSFYQIKGYMEKPQAMLVLGGAIEREIFAADLALQYPDVPVWISSGSNQEYAEWVFEKAGVSLQRLHLDYRAVDTVTNFTTLVDDFHKKSFKYIYLITSDYHIRRASMVARVVFGSRGIRFKQVAVKSRLKPEPLIKAMRDVTRSIVWLVTGKTGSSFYRYWKWLDR